MPDDLEKIAEQVVETIQEAREDAAEEIADADQKADVLSRIDGLEAKAVELESSIQAVPTTMPEHQHTEITDKLEDILSKLAETTEGITEPVTDTAEGIIDTTADTAGGAADTVTDTASSDRKPSKSPERRHGLFSRPFARKAD